MKLDRRILRKLFIGEWSLRRLITSLLLIYLCIAAYAFFFSNRLMFPAPPASYQDTPEILKLTVPGGEKISALYLPNSEARFTILYSHGNGEDLGDGRVRLEDWRRLGFSVFAYDYRGYGTSEGTATEQHAYQDIETAYQHVTNNLNVAPDRLILYGRSIGSGPSVYLATKEKIAGLILETPFTSTFRVVIPFPLLPFDRFANLSRIRDVRVPLLILHGTLDEVVPFSHGQALYQAANQPKTFVVIEGAGHNNLSDVAGDRYGKALKEFAASL